MITLNLTATTTEEVIVKDYLENNVSETLAEKINNGVRIEKDGKTLTNKKTLEHFMDYAGKEAQKQARQGARVAAVYKDAVFNWAIHYFEEDSIHGKLYNEDGTEYKPPVPVKKPTVTSKPTAAPTPAKPKPISLFDMIEEKKLDDFKLDSEPEIAKLDEDEQSEDDDEMPVIKPGVNRFAVPVDVEVIVPEAVIKPVVTTNSFREHPLVRVSEKHCVDADGVVYEMPMPNFLKTLFGDALKVEVGQ